MRGSTWRCRLTVLFVEIKQKMCPSNQMQATLPSEYIAETSPSQSRYSCRQETVINARRKRNQRATLVSLRLIRPRSHSASRFRYQSSVRQVADGLPLPAWQWTLGDNPSHVATIEDPVKIIYRPRPSQCRMIGHQNGSIAINISTALQRHHCYISLFTLI